MKPRRSTIRLRRRIAVLSVALIVLLGLVDYAAGPEVSLSIFYLVPVCLASWYVGRSAGIAAALGSTLMWLLANLDAPHSRYVQYWNAAMLGGFYLITAIILDRLRTSVEYQHELSRRDFLTGLANARAFHDVAEMEKSRVRRYRHPLTFAYLDIDDFKQINDQFGHSVGDAVLIQLGCTMRENLRDTDFVARMGGDEFAILLPETGVDAAQAVLHKLQSVLHVMSQLNQWPATFSIGAVTFLGEPESLDQMIDRADRLMYAAKQGGKDQIAHIVVEGE